MIDKIKYKNIMFNNLSEKDFSNLINSKGLFTFPAAPPLAKLELNSEYHESLIASDYVFFDSGDQESSFLTTHNFQTQFGREVVFEIEKLLDKKFNSEVKKLGKSNPYVEVWRWQNYMFEKTIIKTIKDARKVFKNLDNKYSQEFNKYQFKII